MATSVDNPEYHQELCKGAGGLRIKPRRGRAVMFYNLMEKQYDLVGGTFQN